MPFLFDDLSYFAIKSEIRLADGHAAVAAGIFRIRLYMEGGHQPAILGREEGIASQAYVLTREI